MWLEQHSKITERLHGFDYFISHRKTDGAAYARELHRRLANSSQVSSGEEAIQRATEQAVAALLSLARSGVGVSSQGSFYAGEALDWTRMDYAERRRVMRDTVAEMLAGRSDVSVTLNHTVVLPLKDSPIAFVCDSIPAAMSISAARELVGQPFLADWQTVRQLPLDAFGPVHFIACHRSISETQAIRQLGLPDAVVVAAPFGVYVADRVQCIQMVFIANCRDQTSTRHRVQRFLLWLSQQKEDTQLVRRARSRRRICDVIAAEVPTSTASA